MVLFGEQNQMPRLGLKKEVANSMRRLDLKRQ